MADTTMYVTIPKERVAGILTRENSNYFVEDDEGGEIIINKSLPFGSKHRATITDYKIPEARIESGDVNVESGTVGAKVEYSNSAVYEYLEEYEM